MAQVVEILPPGAPFTNMDYFWSQHGNPNISNHMPNISNHMTSKMWYEITYPFPNFNSDMVEVWK